MSSRKGQWSGLTATSVGGLIWPMRRECNGLQTLLHRAVRLQADDRSGFTLVELLVVISILLILAVLVWAVFKPSNTDRMRSAARIAQSTVLGAKDRALHAKDLRGVGLVSDRT